MMTLDEAIAHAEWCAKESCGECSEEHWQLADWLRELRRARMELDLLRTLREEFRADAQRYKAENDRLRELIEVLINCGRKYHTMNGSCPMFDADAADDDFCGAVQAARELGIEVE